MTPPQEISKGRTLHSWKEIAACLGVTVRSVQRWEQTAGLPVYRQGGGSKARVFAYSAELLRWREAGGYRPEDAEPAADAITARSRVALIGAGAAALVVIAAAGVAWRAGVFNRPVPTEWAVERSVLRVSDEHGKLLWERRLPKLSAAFDTYSGDRAVIADIDGDGSQEILLNYLVDKPGGVGDSVVCFDADGDLRWEIRCGTPKTFGSRSFTADYRPRLLRTVRVGRKPHVLVVANHYVWYPSQVTLLDPATGRVVEEYWHPGNIFQCLIHDLDGDGRDEVLLGAINNPGNGLGHAGIAVLRVPFASAPRPPKAQGEFPPLTGGGEAAYVLLPQPDVNTVSGVLPIIAEMGLDQHRRIMVRLQLAEGAAIYYLDFNLNVLEHRFSDGFPALHNRLHNAGLLDHALSDREMEVLGKAVHFPAAPDGNDPRLGQFWEF